MYDTPFEEQAEPKKVCPTCKSPAPERHPGAWEGGSSTVVDVCKHPWHSSTHAGREMMNKLIGHAYFDQYMDHLKKVTTDTLRATGGAQFLRAEQVGGNDPEDVKYPDDPEREARRRASGRTEPTIAGDERAASAMPGVPGALGRPDLSQVVLNDVAYGLAAIARMQHSLLAYQVQLEKGRALADATAREATPEPFRLGPMSVLQTGKVRDWRNPQEAIYGPVTPRNGDLATIKGASGITMVYLDDQRLPDGPGWYELGAHAIGPLVDDLTPGGTVPVEHGENGDDEMPGMWAASDVMGGSDWPDDAEVARMEEGHRVDEDLTYAREPYERYVKHHIVSEVLRRGMADAIRFHGRDPVDMSKDELIDNLRADDIKRKAHEQRMAEKAQEEAGDSNE